MRLYLGLLHYPVVDRGGRRIASAITTLDLHDLSRVARTYGVKGFSVVTPLEDQQRLAASVLRHWTEGFGATYNPHRKEALELLSVSPSLQETVTVIREREGERPLLVATDAARQRERSLCYEEAGRMLRSGHLMMLLFGTAWGLDKEVIEEADYILEPIEGITGYNHLPVRAAAAITLDRLVGRYPK